MDKLHLLFIIAMVAVIVTPTILLLRTNRQRPNLSLSQPDTTPVSNSTVSPSSSSNLNDLRYPNSTVLNSTSTTLSLESNDNPTNITNWYKTKINDLSFHTKSFVTTNNNDNIANKLVAKSSNQSISVEIKRSSGSSSTTIDISN